MLRLVPSARSSFERTVALSVRHMHTRVETPASSKLLREAAAFLNTSGEEQGETYEVCGYRGRPSVVVPTVEQCIKVPETLAFRPVIEALLKSEPCNVSIASLDMPDMEVLRLVADLAKRKRALAEELSVTILGAPNPDKMEHFLHGKRHIRFITDLLEEDPRQRLDLFFGKTSQLSWNHSKYFVADNLVVLGGINFDPTHYELGVADVALLFDSPALACFTKKHMYMQCKNIATRSEDWSPLSRNWSSHSVVDFEQMTPPLTSTICPSQCLVAVDTYVANKGEGQAASKLIPWLIDKAETDICISQQDIGFSPVRPYLGSKASILRPLESIADKFGQIFVEDIITSMDRAFARGVKIELVLSAEGATAGGVPYYYLGHRETERLLRKNLKPEYHELLTVLPAPRGNHMKAIVVDKRLSLVGSKNMYRTNLDDTVVIIDDIATSATIIEVIKAAAKDDRVRSSLRKFNCI